MGGEFWRLVQHAQELTIDAGHPNVPVRYGHPENKDVMSRLMSLKDKKISVVAKLFGGQGTINVPSWSPDGRQFAFVSYQLLSREDAGK